MKKVFTLLWMTALVAGAHSASAFVLFNSDFSKSTKLADYVNASVVPTNTFKFNALADGGAGTFSIAAGALSFTKTGMATASIVRSTSMAVVGTPVGGMRFSYDVNFTFSQTTPNVRLATAFIGGNGGNSSTQWMAWGIDSAGAPASTAWKIGGVSFTGPQTITAFLNNTGASFTYTAPDGSVAALTNDKWDMWVGNIKVINAAPAAGATQTLQGFAMYLNAFSGTTGPVNYTFDNFKVESLPDLANARPLPLRNLAVNVHLSVRDYGAVPNDGNDDRGAIRNAIAAAQKATGPVQIDFEPGTYDFGGVTQDFEVSTDNAAILLHACNNIIVNGNGSTLMIHRQDVCAFWANASKKIIFRNFFVDYDPLPFSQGIVRAVDGVQGSFEFELQEGFPAPNESFFNTYNGNSFGMLKDPSHPGRLKKNCPDFFVYNTLQDRDALGGNRFHIQLADKNQISNFKIGDVFVIVARAGSVGRFQSGSENITFDRITAYASPGPLFIGSWTSRLNILNCKAVLKGERLITAGGDGVHCQSARIGPWVENCDFEGLSDDCLNIYGRPIHFTEKNSPTQMKVSPDTGVPIQSGDKLVFFDPIDGLTEEATVASFSGNVLVLDAPVTLARFAHAGDSDWYKKDVHAYDLSAVGSGFVFKNNYMHDGRRHGMFIKASDGVIENNCFEGLTGSGIWIANAPTWPEGFWARNLVIQNNWVSDCGYAYSGGLFPCVNIAGMQLNAAGQEISMRAPIQKNISLRHNVFHIASNQAMKLSGVADLIATGNEFTNATGSGPLVTIQYWENITWTGNLDGGRVQYNQ